MMIGNTLITPPFHLVTCFYMPPGYKYTCMAMCSSVSEPASTAPAKTEIYRARLCPLCTLHGNANWETRCSICVVAYFLSININTYLHQNSFITLTPLHQIAFSLIKTVKTLQLFCIYNELYCKEMNGSAVNFKILKTKNLSFSMLASSASCGSVCV